MKYVNWIKFFVKFFHAFLFSWTKEVEKVDWIDETARDSPKEVDFYNLTDKKTSQKYLDEKKLVFFGMASLSFSLRLPPVWGSNDASPFQKTRRFLLIIYFWDVF